MKQIVFYTLCSLTGVSIVVTLFIFHYYHLIATIGELRKANELKKTGKKTNMNAELSTRRFGEALAESTKTTYLDQSDSEFSGALNLKTSVLKNMEQEETEELFPVQHLNRMTIERVQRSSPGTTARLKNENRQKRTAWLEEGKTGKDLNENLNDLRPASDTDITIKEKKR